MAKKVVGYIKLQVKAGQANPSPPVGPALGQRGLNIMEFCKAFNAATQKLEPGLPTPVIITAYSDRTFTFITKTHAGVGAVEEGRGHPVRFQAPEHREGGQGHPQAARGHRQGEGSRPDCGRPGRSGADDCGLAPVPWV